MKKILHTAVSDYGSLQNGMSISVLGPLRPIAIGDSIGIELANNDREQLEVRQVVNNEIGLIDKSGRQWTAKPTIKGSSVSTDLDTAHFKLSLVQ